MTSRLITILFLAIVQLVSGQITLVELGDTTFLNQNTTGLWDFKEDLDKGTYYIVEFNECGIDTLKSAHFSEKGIKDCVWIEWRSKLCIGYNKGSSDTIESWSFAMNRQVREFSIEYNSNRKVKAFFYQDNKPLSEFHYADTKKNELTEILFLNKDGSLEEKFTLPDKK